MNLSNIRLKGSSPLSEVHPNDAEVLGVILPLKEPCFFHTPEDYSDSGRTEAQGFGDFPLGPSILFPEEFKDKGLSPVKPDAPKEVMVPDEVVPEDLEKKRMQ